MQIFHLRRIRLLLTLAIGTGLQWSCGEKQAPVEVIEPPAPTVTAITVSTSASSLTVGETTTLTAVARDGSGMAVANTPITWTALSPTIATISGSAMTANITVTAVAPGTATFTASGAGRSASGSVTVTAPPQFDAQIVDAQWTQGAQQLDGAIPMVLGGNAAVLNVLLSASGGIGAGGQLVLTATDNSGVVVYTDTVVLGVISSATPTFAAPTAQFLVPAIVLRAGMRWQLVRDPKQIVPDIDAVNDRFPRAAAATLATVVLPTLRLKFVPIVLSTHSDATGNVSSGNVNDYLPSLLRMVPVGGLETSIGAPLATSASFGTPPSGGADQFWLQVLAELDLARVADAGSRGTYWIGVVRPPAGFNNTAFGGFSYIPSVPTTSGPGNRTTVLVQTGWFNNTGQTADLVAHELGHAFGRRHSPCGSPSGVDPNYPTANGSIGIAGHDVRSWALGQTSSAAAKSASTGDVMGYCFPQWSSPYTYVEMLLSRQLSAPIVASATPLGTPGALGVQLREQPLPARQTVVVVRGQIDGGQIALLPAVAIAGYPTERNTDIPTLLRANGWPANSGTNSSAVRIELVDEMHQVMADQLADVRAVDHSPVFTFVAAIPLSDRDAARVSAVRVTTSTGAIAQRQSVRRATIGTRAGATAPLVQRRALSRDTLAQLTTVNNGVTSVQCRDQDMIALVVQDHETGAVLASSPTNRVSIRAQTSTRIDITCSDGVRSQRQTDMRVGQRR